MKRILLVPCAALSFTFVSPGQSPYTLPAVESVSVSRSSTQVFQDNRLRAYNNPSSTLAKVVGLFKFDLSSIPPTDDIVSMRLTLTMENQFNSPFMNPIVNLLYSPDDSWTRATATTASGTGNVVVTPNQSGFQFPSHTFTVDLTRHNFRKDLVDGFVTLVIENVNPAYSYVYFFGHTGTPVGPNAQLQVTTTPCRGTFAFFGNGGKDSKAFSVESAAQGCPDLGKTLGIGASLGDANTAPILVFLGRSRTSWGAISLPFDLSALGAPGNSIYASLQIFVGAVSSPGGAVTSLSIPSDPALNNANLFFQSLVVDLAANSAGIVTTDGVQATLK